MKATELRIGNYYDHCGEIKKVTVGVIENVFDSERIWCKPIELTEEILLKCGFEKSNNLDTFYHLPLLNEWTALFYSCKHGVFEISISKHGTVIKVKYVHQLQNLYFALTGEELEFNI